jgi:cyclomaltodextrin glucanotransferase
VRGNEIEGKALAMILVNGAPTKPGDRLAVIGDCPELGCWDLERAIELECVNPNTWFGEIPFDPSAGQTVSYKYVIFPADQNAAPHRENRWVRRRLIPPEKCVKWRDQWEL